MRFLLSCFIVCFLLTGCVYHQRIEQGNILTPQKTEQIKIGMSESQVIAILGTPILRNLYDDHRLIYVYTDHPKRSHFIKNKLIITFRNNHVVDIQTNITSLTKL